MTQPATTLRGLLTTLSLTRAGVAIATASPTSAEPPGQALDRAVFDQLKALAGRWEGRVDDATGTPVALEVAVTSNGHAVLNATSGREPWTTG